MAAWMVIWWISEAAPLPITALLPIAIYPLAGIATVGQASAPYASPIIFLFMGGFMIALGLEKHNLHRRIALNLIKITGTHANGIILGFMLATAFLSMWISNTATTVMMLPIAMSVIGLLESSDSKIGEPDRQKSFGLFSVALLLSIAYSANVGGAATIIGTPPNVVLIGYLNEILDYEMDFSRWLLIGVPISALLLGVIYLMLTRILYPNNLGKIEGSDQIIESQLLKLGKLSKEEKLVLIVFLLTAFGWVFKNYINDIIGANLLNDTVTAMTGGILMFIMPVNIKNGDFLMQWEDAKRLPWGILILFGGGLSLARGMESSGLIQLIGDSIAGNNFSTVILATLLISTMLFMTEIMSNVALTTIFIPVVIGITQGLGIESIGIAIPVTIAASCAFMMPISTPPNAIVFASGRIQMRQMIKAGFFLNIISIIILVVATFTIIKWVFA